MWHPGGCPGGLRLAMPDRRRTQEAEHQIVRRKEHRQEGQKPKAAPSSNIPAFAHSRRRSQRIRIFRAGFWDRPAAVRRLLHHRADSDTFCPNLPFHEHGREDIHFHHRSVVGCGRAGGTLNQVSHGLFGIKCALASELEDDEIVDGVGAIALCKSSKSMRHYARPMSLTGQSRKRP